MSEELNQLPKKASPWNTGMKWGVILFAVNTGLYLLMHMNTDYTSVESLQAAQENGIVQYGSLVLMVALIVLAQLEHRKKDLGGFMSYGRAVGIGAIIFLVMGILDAMFMYIEFSMLHPEAIKTLIQIQMQNLQEMGMTENMDRQYENAKKFTTPGSIAFFKFLITGFLGIVLTLIVSIFTRKANPDEI